SYTPSLHDALPIYQRAARIAGIDGGIGLDKVLVHIDAKPVTTQRGHDPQGRGLTHPERVANGQHNVAHAQTLVFVEFNGLYLGQCDLQHREIGFRVGPHHFGVRLPPVVQRHTNRIGRLHHVVVGENVAVAADDYTRAEAAGLPTLTEPWEV